MIPVHKIEELIPNLTGILVLIIAGCSFVLSFFNLQEVATDAGITPWLSWAWPLCIDCLLVAGSLMILKNSIRNEKATVGWAVLLSFTVVSTVFNITHSDSNLISQLAHAIPPVALCVSIELLMIIVKSDLKTYRTPAVKTAGQIKGNGPSVKKYFAENPGASISQASKDLKIHRNTVGRYKKNVRSC